MPDISGELLYKPKEQNNLTTFTDRVEIRCLKEERISIQDIISEIGLVEEGENQDAEIELEGFIDDLFEEFASRRKMCSGNYPFNVNSASRCIALCNSMANLELYKFLLFTTNGNMRDNCINNDVNGTLLFEKLSEITVKLYLGSKSETYLFGTANNESKSFLKRIEDLTQKMNEGKGFKNQPADNYRYKKDDGLNIVAWIPFDDGYPGKLIAFGQCKTGTSWDNVSLSALQPDSFCKKWFIDQPVINPIRLFFLSEGLSRQNWYNTSTLGGIIFDRFRIMALLETDTLTKNINYKVSAWLRGWNIT